jgi:hypothetical protein
VTAVVWHENWDVLLLSTQIHELMIKGSKKWQREGKNQDSMSQSSGELHPKHGEH